MHLGSFLTNNISQKNLKYVLINNNSHESISRLSEMGCIPGVLVRSIKKNPFGGTDGKTR